MAEKFFTSDLHFFHKNIVKYCNRPWSVEGQTEELIKRWNSKVGMFDEVYCLGDFAFTNKIDETEVLIRRLNGDITFVRGNHDDKRLWKDLSRRGIPNLSGVHDYYELKIDRNKICMSHYPMAVWNNCHHGSWMLHGHSHGSYRGNGKILDVGIDNHPDFQVFSYDEVKEYMANQEFVANDHHTAY